MKRVVTAEEAKRCVEYNPLTGQFSRLDGAYPLNVTASLARRPVGHVNPRTGYVQINVCYSQIRAHRLAWLMVYGEWPNGCLDHINGNRSDNRISNLRLATPSENALNAKKKSTARTSSLKGAIWNKRKRKWMAQIKVNKRRHFLGLFDTEQECHAAYCAAARELAGEFARPA